MGTILAVIVTAIIVGLFSVYVLPKIWKPK